MAKRNTNTLIYTPTTPSGSSANCQIMVSATDLGTSSSATPPASTNTLSSIITIYPTPTLTNLKPSNAIIDLGQSETFNVMINGGSNKDMSLALYVAGPNNVIEYLNNAGDGVQTFNNFIPTNSQQDLFYVNGLDSGVTTPMDIAPSALLSIMINSAPTSTLSASNTSIYANQESTLTSNIIGGTPSYSYQWYVMLPGATSFTPISGATNPTFLFNLSTMTTGGAYTFRLTTTDSASTPEVFNSTNAIILVNNTFTNNLLVLNVSAKITNDPDSGNAGYWALDNLTRNIKVWQSAIPMNALSSNSYIAQINDNGIVTTFAGAMSPGAGIIEPNNGIVDRLKRNVGFVAPGIGVNEDAPGSITYH